VGIRHVQIDSTGTVSDIVIWDGMTAIDPPITDTLIESDTAQIGDTWDGSKFTPGPPAGQPMNAQLSDPQVSQGSASP
jgi:hypothetical protein